LLVNHFYLNVFQGIVWHLFDFTYKGVIQIYFLKTLQQLQYTVDSN